MTKINIRETLLSSGISEFEIGTEDLQTATQRRRFEFYTRLIEKIAAEKLADFQSETINENNMANSFNSVNSAGWNTKIPPGLVPKPMPWPDAPTRSQAPEKILNRTTIDFEDDPDCAVAWRIQVKIPSGYMWNYTEAQVKINGEPLAGYQSLYTEKQVLEKIKAAVLVEREACAKLCDEIKNIHVSINMLNTASGADFCAAAIREKGRKMTEIEQSDSMIYLIEKFWTDSLENHPSYASGYSVVGYVIDENKAKQLISEAGTYAGTGWPIQKEKTMPMMRYKAIKKLNTNHD